MSETPRTDRMVASWPLESFGEMTGLARQLERENAALREQLSERDAEIAALKGHAEAMAGEIRTAFWGGNPSTALARYRAAYPKEADK